MRDLARSLLDLPRKRRTLAASRREFCRPEVVRSLLEASYDRRYDDVEEGYELACVASMIASHLDSETRVDAYTGLANAARLAGNFAEAKRAISLAREHLNEGSLERRARLCEIEATLKASQRDFASASALIQEAVDIRERLGESEKLARALVKQAIFSGASGKPAAAVRIVRRALPLISAPSHRLAFSALHALAWNLMEAGAIHESETILLKAERLIAGGSEPLLSARCSWLHGKLAKAVGNLVCGLAELKHAQTAFLDRDMPYEAALVSIDLAEILALLGQWGPLRELTSSLVPIFEALGVGPEAAASASLMAAIDSAPAWLELLRNASTALRMPTPSPP